MAQKQQLPSEKLKQQIAVVEVKIYNINCKANELDSRMQDSWGFEDDKRARKLWGKISHCENQIKDLNKKKARLEIKLAKVEAINA